MLQENHPVLAGSAPPPKRVGWRLTRLDEAENAFPGIVASAYEQPVVRQSSPFGSFFVVSDPDGVRQVLVDDFDCFGKHPTELKFLSALLGNGLLSSDGETWREHRRTHAPFFTPRAVSGYAAEMLFEVDDYLSSFSPPEGGATVDMAAEMNQLALRIVCRTLFSTDGSDIAKTMDDAMDRGRRAMSGGIFDFVPFLQDIRHRDRQRRIEEIFSDLDLIINRLIDLRRGGNSESDLLSCLAEIYHSKSDAFMTKRDVRDHLLTMFVAGHETTAASLAWTWYLLGTHPDVEANVHRELEQVVGSRRITPDDLPNLRYTRSVIDESLRLYPPIAGLSIRIARRATNICGVEIPKGAQVLISPWIVHRYKPTWESAGLFDPSRFSDGPPAGAHRFSYIPFGAGPRTCIGGAFSIMELLAVVASLARRYRFSLPPGHKVELSRHITLRPRNGLPMLVHRRATVNETAGLTSAS